MQLEERDGAIFEVNDSSLGLQAEIVTDDRHKVYRMWDELEAGEAVHDGGYEIGLLAIYHTARPANNAWPN